MEPFIISISLNPAWQKIYLFSSFSFNKVNRVKKILSCAAGKGVNVARTITQLKGKVICLGYIGGKQGLKFKDYLEKEKIPAEVVEIGSDLRICTTLIDEATGNITEITEPGGFVSTGEKVLFKQIFNYYIFKASALVLSGTIPPGESMEIYNELINLAKQRGVLTFLDTSGEAARKSLLASPDIFKVNRAELGEICGKDIKSKEEIVSEAWKLKKIYGVKTILITNGASEVVGVTDKDSYLVIPPKVKVINSIGSGDAFSAGYIYSFIKHRLVEESLLVGTACGTANTLNYLPGQVLTDDLDKIRKNLELQKI